MASTRAPKRPRTASDYIELALSYVARLSAVALTLSALYLFVVVFSDGLRVYPQGFTTALSNQLTHNIQTGAEVMFLSAVALSACIVLLYWGLEWAGVIFLLLGVLFYVGIPYVSVPHMSQASLNPARQNHPGTDLLLAYRLTSGAFLAAAALFLTGWAWQRLRETLSAPRRVGGMVRIPFYSSCWQSHFCKDEINKLCEPGRKGFHKSCWRYKSGCFCDESIGDKVMATARQSAGKDAAKWFGVQARPPAPTFADRFQSTHHRVVGQKIACADCPIYNFHELQKHRILAPIVLLSLPALMYYYSDMLNLGYQRFVAALDGFALHLIVVPGRSHVIQNQVHGALDVPVVEWLVFGILLLVALSAAARFLEFWCFEAKL